jgi:hypothetical protein
LAPFFRFHEAICTLYPAKEGEGFPILTFLVAFAQVSNSPGIEATGTLEDGYAKHKIQAEARV